MDPAMLRFAFILCFASFAATSVDAQSATPVGVWLHPNGRIQMEISPCGDALCANLVWFKQPNDDQGVPWVDVNNPDPALRTRPLLGLTVLKGLRRTASDTWEDGKVYNPDDGGDYTALMSVQNDGTLHVRAYVVLPMLGKSLTWTRVR
jgi:uncharacterized protein (DUF2147 family)